jgi:hypothetical protein
MKERPILFSGPMVRAILDGSKTQTRRIVKPQPQPFIQCTPDRHPTTRTEPYIDAYCGEPKTLENPRGMGLDWHWWTADNRTGAKVARCPYGRPGDRLWVRETLYRKPDAYFGWGYQTDGTPVGGYLKYPKRVVPSIHMPRWASRITLEIVAVRVERLQEISEDDARAEGCRHDAVVNVRNGKPTLLVKYRDLWESINGPGSWDANPWVWVISFRRVC